MNIVSKSGTNDFHGNLFEFIRNGDLNARNFFAPTHDDVKRNQFGFTVGGPVLKNRLFYFGSYEGTRLRDVVKGLTQFVPTEAQRGGDLSGIAAPIHDPVTGVPYPNNQIPLSQFNPVTKALLGYILQSPSPDGKNTSFHSRSCNGRIKPLLRRITCVGAIRSSDVIFWMISG